MRESFKLKLSCLTRPGDWSGSSNNHPRTLHPRTLQEGKNVSQNTCSLDYHAPTHKSCETPQEAPSPRHNHCDFLADCTQPISFLSVGFVSFSMPSGSMACLRVQCPHRSKVFFRALRWPHTCQAFFPSTSIAGPASYPGWFNPNYKMKVTNFSA